VEAMMRTETPLPPSICIASAPASRSSSMVSRMTDALIGALPWNILITTPGPCAARVPARMPSSSAR